MRVCGTIAFGTWHQHVLTSSGIIAVLRTSLLIAFFGMLTCAVHNEKPLLMTKQSLAAGSTQRRVSMARRST